VIVAKVQIARRAHARENAFSKHGDLY